MASIPASTEPAAPDLRHNAPCFFKQAATRPIGLIRGPNWVLSLPWLQRIQARFHVAQRDVLPEPRHLSSKRPNANSRWPSRRRSLAVN